jgi:hypothetical protein
MSTPKSHIACSKDTRVTCIIQHLETTPFVNAGAGTPYRSSSVSFTHTRTLADMNEPVAPFIDRRPAIHGGSVPRFQAVEIIGKQSGAWRFTTCLKQDAGSGRPANWQLFGAHVHVDAKTDYRGLKEIPLHDTLYKEAA